MADALLTSQAVFRSRAIEVGFTEAAVEVAVSEGIASMGSFGFSTPFIPGLYYQKFILFLKGLSKAFSRPLKVGPGQQEEGPLKELAKSLFNVAPDADLTRAQLTSVRRLYLEAGI